MSGGSWNYLYSKLDNAIGDLLDSKDPLRRAFGKHLELVAEALHDIEWVDSGDCGSGDEEDAIKRVLGDTVREKTLSCLQDDLLRLKRQLSDLDSEIGIFNLEK